MHIIYRKILTKKFDERIQHNFPEFKLDKYDKNPMRKSTDRDYMLMPVDGTRIYISLVLRHKGWDEFRCVISWSKLDRFPEPKPAFYGRDSFDEKEGYVPLRILCGEHDSSWQIERKSVPPPTSPKEMFDDYRGLVEEEAEEIIEPMIADLFEKLSRCGRPFIQDFVTYLTKAKTVGHGRKGA